tara:strand:- start:588 stop:1346 length:759 start_codon:yes stop_codon:yes gene_type:complete
MLEVFLLSLIQGITEFIPVSSSSHLIIFSDYINFNNQSLNIDISLHIGSFLAVLFYFKKDIINFIKNKNLFLKIIVASLPVMIIGFLLVQTNFIEKLRSLEVIAWTTLIFGILLYISDKQKLSKNIHLNFSYKSAIIIGLLQVLSLIPGVSRSGISITGARFLQFKRIEAAKISFLLSIPTLGAVTIFGLRNLYLSDNLELSALNLISIICSFIFSFVTIHFFLRYIQKFSLNLFVIYRLILGIVLLFLAYL